MTDKQYILILTPIMLAAFLVLVFFPIGPEFL